MRRGVKHCTADLHQAALPFGCLLSSLLTSFEAPQWFRIIHRTQAASIALGVILRLEILGFTISRA